jgi:hypothetical protein
MVFLPPSIRQMDANLSAMSLELFTSVGIKVPIPTGTALKGLSDYVKWNNCEVQSQIANKDRCFAYKMVS